MVLVDRLRPGDEGNCMENRLADAGDMEGMPEAEEEVLAASAGRGDFGGTGGGKGEPPVMEPGEDPAIAGSGRCVEDCEGERGMETLEGGVGRERRASWSLRMAT